MTHSHDTATPALSVESREVLSFAYTNWRGETALRRVRAKGACFRFGATEWHPEPQWLLSAIDLDKMEGRDFAVRDIVFAAPAPNPSPAAKGGDAGAMRERIARALNSVLGSEDDEHPRYHPAQKSWEKPSEVWWTQWLEAADAVLAALATSSTQPADAVRGALTKLVAAAHAMGDACNSNLCDEAIAEGRTALESDPAPAGEAVEPDDPNLWHFWNEKARWLAVKLATAERERDDARKALKSAAVSLERAAGRFNMMGGVGLVNGADPKAGYTEAYEACRVVHATLATEASR